MTNKFLPVNMEDMKDRGWEQLDFILITGDAYVDHPSFGHAIISRLLESHGYKVGIIAQPDWKNTDDFKRLGKPRLAFLVNSGNVDSMVNHYTVFKRKRSIDEYSKGGRAGNRPDRAVIVYSNRIKEAYNDVPVIIGGLEASLRRFGHYDYWDNKIRRSILLDSKADILIYGMGEKPVVELAAALDSGIDITHVKWINGTTCKVVEPDLNVLKEEYKDAIILPSFDEIKNSKEAYGESFKIQYQNNDFINGSQLVEPYENNTYVLQNTPAQPLSTIELDDVYELPYMGTYHPSYEQFGGVPAIKEVRFSITANRGCFGSCSFCALTYHQGRVVQGRSKESLAAEAERLTELPDFKGYIHDVGGPTANFRRPSCKRQLTLGTCKDRECLWPTPCPHLEIDHQEYLDILKEIRSLPKIKKVFIRSGIRYDYAIYDKKSNFIEELSKHHISGTLKIAPEHVSKRVLYQMRKPEKEVFEKFLNEYKRVNEKLESRQFIIPYFISSHPGSTMEDAILLAEYLKKSGFIPDQVQDFYPTPGTLATCIYYTGIDPFTKRKVYVPTDMEEKKMQKALIHFNKPENRKLVEEALRKAGRNDLIGFGKDCLIRPLDSQRGVR
ncbi:MAG: YgiQ family radical SAM protein [Eubacteriales bacterium]